MSSSPVLPSLPFVPLDTVLASDASVHAHCKPYIVDGGTNPIYRSMGQQIKKGLASSSEYVHLIHDTPEARETIARVDALFKCLIATTELRVLRKEVPGNIQYTCIRAKEMKGYIAPSAKGRIVEADANYRLAQSGVLPKGKPEWTGTLMAAVCVSEMTLRAHLAPHISDAMTNSLYFAVVSEISLDLLLCGETVYPVPLNFTYAEAIVKFDQLFTCLIHTTDLRVEKSLVGDTIHYCCSLAKVPARGADALPDLEVGISPPASLDAGAASELTEKSLLDAVYGTPRR